jgi:hypothetical protein
MTRRSPTLEGFKILFRLPSLGLAEIAWRWSFGFAVLALLAFSFREYLSTLPVTAAEMFLLQSRQPLLVLQAVARILQGSGPRAILGVIVLTPALTLAWIVLASLGRIVTLKSLFESFGMNTPSRDTGRFSSLMGLNFLRAAWLLAALIGVVGAVVLAGRASSKTDSLPGAGLLIFWMLTMFIGLAWSTLNWCLSFAAIFVVRDNQTTFSALASAAGFCLNRPGSMAAAATWFGIAHAVAFTIAMSAVAFPLGLAEVLPGAMVMGGVILVAVLYFAVVDFLYVGRLAAYVYLMEFPETIQPVSAQPVSRQPVSDDDILSDIPGLVPGT